jgi:hypothetical protein
VLGGPVYRSTLTAAPVGRPTRSAPGAGGWLGATGPASYTEPVPPDVAAPFRALTGLDVAGIPVHRGPAVSQQARAYQARAFTRSGEIFLPDEAGPLGHGETRALLAHELTHAIQQRVLSSSVPDEGSPRGQELEAEASAAEHWYRSEGTAPLRLAHLPAAASSWSSPPGPTATTGVQRQAGEYASAGAVAEGGEEPRPASGPGVPATVAAADDAGWLTGLTGLTVAPEEAASAGRQFAVLSDGRTTAAAGRKELDDLAERSERLIELSGQRPADLDDPASLDELTSMVYPRLRSMLRSELLVDRERAGLLADIS